MVWEYGCIYVFAVRIFPTHPLLHSFFFFCSLSLSLSTSPYHALPCLLLYIRESSCSDHCGSSDNNNSHIFILNSYLFQCPCACLHLSTFPYFFFFCFLVQDLNSVMLLDLHIYIYMLSISFLFSSYSTV